MARTKKDVVKTGDNSIEGVKIEKKEVTKITSDSRPRKSKVEIVKIESDGTTSIPSPKSKKRKLKAEDDTIVEQEDTPKKRSKIVKTKVEVKEEIKSEDQPGEAKVKRKRKTKEEKEAEAMPLAARTVGHKLFIGAHVSASGGVHKAVLNSVHIGANAFALFLKSQRKWANPALADDVAAMFHANCKTHTYDPASHVVPHGSYLVNLAHTDPERTKQAYDSFLDDLQRCERLGIKLYNFHPGNTTGGDRATAIKHLASNINRAHKETKSVVTLLENMAAGGNIIGTTFEDLRDTISHVEDKERVGVCLDTCHAFAAGYDLRSPEAFKATLQQFDDIVGMKYLRALHINDSKAPFESHRDLHANIGTGYLGLRAFHNVVNEPRFIGLPLVLETPTTTTDDDGDPIKDEKGKEKEDPSSWAREIKLLESMVDMDVESEEFLALEKALARKGEKERKRVGDQAQRRKEKDAKKAAKGKKKGAKDDASESSELSELEED
ncbi:hypothetical protein AMS68_001770 [Peltaster fructicola]|uniref:Apurinic-apyrimidinic endonuclease 1 n=1 Tax=Peltaster fructicola TaxID=286661 RepID=A0A6H0XNF9_9PEZI|nr:hypothetical protein AMS68_001770 [Peltaster fructicola]